MKINRLVLASTSPYRKALLERVGIYVETASPTADEDKIDAETPSLLALARSEGKGLSLTGQPEATLALAADQVMEFEGRSYGKAFDRTTAFQQLMAMQGKAHKLHSAYSLVLYNPEAGAPRLLRSRLVTACMTMRSLTAGEIEAYLDTDEWKGCAGSYQFEHRGLHLFGEVDGDLDTIVGLPLRPLLQDFRDLGLNLLTHPRGPWSLLEV